MSQFADLRTNAARPLFSGELGRDLEEMERRTSQGRYNNSASMSQARNHQDSSTQNNNNINNPTNNQNTNATTPNLNPQFAPYAPRTPLVEHHHLGDQSSLAAAAAQSQGRAQSQQQQPGGNYSNNPQQQQNYNNQSYNSQQQQPQNQSYNNNQQYNNNSGYDNNTPGNNASNTNTNNINLSPSHGIRGPSQSGAWSLLPPQIPRPIGLQRFLDDQFAPTPEEQQQQQNNNNNNGMMSPDVMSPGNAGDGERSMNRRSTPASNRRQQQQQGDYGRSSMSTRGRSSPSTRQNNNPQRQDQIQRYKEMQKSARKGGASRRGGNNSYGSPFSGGTHGNSSDDEADADPIATGAARRRADAANDSVVNSTGVSEFAQSLGIGTAEAVAAKMAAEVARQAAQKPQLTSEDLQSNSSMGTSKDTKSVPGGVRPSEVQLMKRRLDRIEDGLARASMRQQLAQERLKNVVASGIVADDGVQTDFDLMPLDTGEKRKAALLDPSRLDASSIGGSTQGAFAASAGGGGKDGPSDGNVGGGLLANDERDQEALQKMQMMKGSGMVLMPAVPYEHFKYVPPDISSALETKKDRDAKQPPGQAKVEAKNHLESRLDQLQLANEELLVRSRIVPTQPDQVGSNRPAPEMPVDPTSIIAHVDPKEQFAGQSPSGRAPQPNVVGSTIDHTSAAYRQQHQNISAPAGGYGSVMDAPKTQQEQEEAARWQMAKARNESEGISFTTGETGPLGASSLQQLRTQQDDTGLYANAALRTLPQGSQKESYDARKKWNNVSFEVPGTKFEGKALGEISSEAQGLYGVGGAQNNSENQPVSAATFE